MQTKKQITICILAVIVFVLGGLLLWQSRREVPVLEPIAPSLPVLQALVNRPPEEISRVYITRGDIVVPFQQDEAWYMMDYPGFLLDQMLVQEMVRPTFQLIAQTAHESTEGIELADFGLAPPLLSMTAYCALGERLTLHLGSVTPDGTLHFLMKEGHPAIYLIPARVAWHMQLTEGDLLCRQLPFLQSENITEFRIIQREREEIYFTRKSEEDASPHMQAMGIIQMTVQEPAAMAGRTVESFQIRRGVMEAFSQSFVVLEAAAVNPTDLTPFGLHDPFMDFRFDSDEGGVHLLFGDAFMREINGTNVPYVFVKFNHRPHVFVAPFAPLLHISDLNAMQFISRFIVMVSILDVEYITIEHENPDYNLHMVINHHPHEDNNAIFPTINGAEVAESDFRVIYRLLVSLGTDGHVDPFMAEGTPVFTITYHLLDGTKKRIEYFAFDTHFYAFSVDGDYVWAVTNHRNVQLFFDEAMCEANQ
ncbi:MAG: DUF4340 domain-containing protein [Defluviitaleaceae bacterium]|nr:DUF4340 domain-containing protein [Defluviitaleaceae bacterium]MCL2274824.1 DUF4340 domain-containing protein [Defluviitaleaceae bacterium]